MQMPYDDGQEMLIFGLSQFDPVKYLLMLGEVFRYWYTTDKMEICTGTGMVGDIHKCNIYAEPECYKSWHFWDE